MIRLRDLKGTDKEKIRKWRNSSQVSKYMYTDHHITSDEHEQWFNRILKDQTSRYWIIDCNDEDVGLVNIYNLDLKNKRCDWAFYIAEPSARGKGVGSYIEYSVMKYVFEDLGLNKLCCEVLDFNEGIVNMHKRFGFSQEGYYREHIIKGKEKFDVIALAMLRDDWKRVEPEIMENLRKKGLL